MQQADYPTGQVLSDAKVNSAEIPARRTASASSRLASGVAKLSFGRALSMLVALCLGPVIARIYTPQDFGVLGILESIGYWILTFVHLGYAQAIPLSRDRAEIRSLTWLCTMIMVVVTAITSFVMVPGKHRFAAWFNEPLVERFMWYVPVFVLLSGIISVVTYVLAREGRFGLSAVITFISTDISYVVRVALGLSLGAGTMFLVMGGVIGSLIGVLVAIPVMAGLLRSPGRVTDDRGPSIVEVARRHKQFPTVQVWNSLVNVSAQSLPMILMGMLFSSSVAGQYSLCRKMIAIPIFLLAGSLNQVFYPEAAQEWRERATIEGTVRRSMKIIVSCYAFPLTALALLGPFLFVAVFGSAWAEAGRYAQILAPFIFAQMLVSPLSTVFLIRERSGLLLGFNILVLGIWGACMLVGASLGGPVPALAMLSGTGAFAYAVLGLHSLRSGNVSWSNSMHAIIQGLISSSLALFPVAVVQWFAHRAWLTLTMLGLSLMVYSTYLYVREPAIKAIFQSLLRRMYFCRSPVATTYRGS